MANLTVGQEFLNISLVDTMREILPGNFFTSLSFLLSLTKIVGVAFLVYILFLIIQAIVKIRQALRIKSIEKYLADINDKLDILISKKAKKVKE
jgi:uncharacterized membrane protein